MIELLAKVYSKMLSQTINPGAAITETNTGWCGTSSGQTCRMVPDVAKQFFPNMAVGFEDPRVTVHITDGIKYVQEAEENSFDAIIVDSSDPVGPAEVLFQRVRAKLSIAGMQVSMCRHLAVTSPAMTYHPEQTPALRSGHGQKQLSTEPDWFGAILCTIGTDKQCSKGACTREQ